jgi:hypothetical protein
MCHPPIARSCRTRCRISSVSVPPISSVIGVSRTNAIAARARYEAADSAYQPDGSRA